ncbi:hypothetical protein H0H81_009694 [Sphagnurus paluster]|uniref:Protein phosphatase n=1 Tax=Sphagnurus paluster TaxID=117069 RepID=A0A9P7GVN3_9AGAR|nr:hypothetical protein H0H81_009694 [Sphagnurus paluster]
MKSGLPPPGIHKRFYNVLPRPSVAVASSSQHRPRPRSNSASLYTNSLLPLSFFDSPPPPPSRLPHAPPRLPGEPKQHNTNPNPLALTPSPLTNDDAPSQLLFPFQYTSHVSFDNIHRSSTPLQSRQKRPRARYQLDVGAYGIPKRCHQNRRPYTSEALQLAVQVGEDAYFVRDNAMGVADGVGGWSRVHAPLDPTSPSPSALFARRLMHFTSAELEPPLECPTVDPGPVQDLESHLADLSDGIDVLQILERAYENTVKAHVQPATSAPLHTGSSTALVAVLENVDEPVLKIAHIGDCMGMLVRGDEVVWRSEEMWWAFNTPVQLSPPPRPPSPAVSLLSTSPSHLQPPPPPKASPVSVTPSNTAQIITLPVRPDDILILASDGLSDNLWDEDVLDEIARFRRSYPDTCAATNGVQVSTATATATAHMGPETSHLRRHTLAGMLSEALCSRARRVSERRPSGAASPASTPRRTPEAKTPVVDEDETPFGRRARELGKSFSGGKRDGE